MGNARGGKKEWSGTGFRKEMMEVNAGVQGEHSPNMSWEGILNLIFSVGANL
jgi:hypothetical protein